MCVLCVSAAISTYAAQAWERPEVSLTAAAASSTPSSALLPRLPPLLPVRVYSTCTLSNGLCRTKVFYFLHLMHNQVSLSSYIVDKQHYALPSKYKLMFIHKEARSNSFCSLCGGHETNKVGIKVSLVPTVPIAHELMPFIPKVVPPM